MFTLGEKYLSLMYTMYTNALNTSHIIICTIYTHISSYVESIPSVIWGRGGWSNFWSSNDFSPTLPAHESEPLVMLCWHVSSNSKFNIGGEAVSSG